MATVTTFNNKQVFEPGAYARIIGGRNPNSSVEEFGAVVLIDTGSGKSFVSGSGINGELLQNVKSVYELDSYQEAKDFMKGGLLWDLQDYLWSPSNNSAGIQKLYFIKAATTTAPKAPLEVDSLATISTALLQAADSTHPQSTRVNASGISGGDKFRLTISATTITVIAVPGDTQLSLLTKVAAAFTASTLNTTYSAAMANSSGVDYLVISHRTNNIVFTLTWTVKAALTVASKTEGTYGNGVIDGTTSRLTQGFAFKMRSGVLNSNKYILDFFEGQFKGLDEDGAPFDLDLATIVANNVVKTVATSLEFSTLAELYDWMDNDDVFNSQFMLFSRAVNTAYTFTSTDLTTYGTLHLFAGGTCQYQSGDLDDVLASIGDLDNAAFLVDNWGKTVSPTSQEKLDGINKGAMCTENLKILSHALTESVYTDKLLYVGGGTRSSEFDNTGTSDGSIQIAQFYNSKLGVVAHSGIEINNITKNAFYFAAMLCGRANGLEPQIPVTYKDLRITGLTHELKPMQRKKALLSGVTHMKNVRKLGWVVNQGITTMQLNNKMIAIDGSPSIQIMRIIHQMNKELVIDATANFPGGNLKTASAQEIKAFTETFLQARTVENDRDGMLINWKNVTAAFSNGKWDIRYCATPNAEVDQLFFTGVFLDPNIQIQ